MLPFRLSQTAAVRSVMPRRKRMYLPEVPVHLVQRGNNRAPCFFCMDDYTDYLRWLREASIRYGVSVHAWCLMTNHVHLLLTPREEDSIPRTMQHIGRCYVRQVNQRQGRTGTLWEGRSKASLVQTTRYLLRAYVYIELNPVRARMVRAPGDYRWSSFGVNALGRPGDVVDPHSEYLALGATPVERQRAYLDLVSGGLQARHTADIREAWRSNMPLGSRSLLDTVESRLGRKVGKRGCGRPLSG